VSFGDAMLLAAGVGLAIGGFALGLWIPAIAEAFAARWRRPQPAVQTSARALSAMTQDDYDALLASDEGELREHWRVDDAGDHQCGRCGRITDCYVTTRHPIIAGPDDDESHAFDCRTRPWCESCDGTRSTWTALGAAVRLPWLGGSLVDGSALPVRLLPRLYKRPVFHELGIVVAVVTVAPAPKTKPE
jgi:hypothetical protein